MVDGLLYMSSGVAVALDAATGKVVVRRAAA
jgi:hypothetical protein